MQDSDPKSSWVHRECVAEDYATMTGEQLKLIFTTAVNKVGPVNKNKVAPATKSPNRESG